MYRKQYDSLCMKSSTESSVKVVPLP